MTRFKYVLALVLIVPQVVLAQAQMIPRSSLEDTVLGWIKVYNFARVQPPVKVDDKVYSPAQLAIADSFANWIQASYLPKGGLGDVVIAVSQKLNPYNQNEAARPQTYGARAKTYFMLKYDSNRKIVPYTTDRIEWTVMANEAYGTPTDSLNTPTQYYFTLPSFEEQGYSFTPSERALVDLSTHPTLKKYHGYYQRNSSIGNGQSILLSKDNKLPYITITKGEYLQAVESAITRAYDKEKKSIYEKDKGDQRSIDYDMKYLDAKNDKRITGIKNNKAKYANRLQETAKIFTTQPDIMLENYPDVFEGNGASRLSLPVYKIHPALAELCKTDKPQWILVTWYGGVTDPIGYQQHQAVINNFNFDYVHDYFFDPDKVKGQPYKPLHSPSATERTAVTDASPAATASLSDKNVHFFEDFSTTAVGSKPAGWSVGLVATTARVDGLPGNWAVMSSDGASVLTPRKLPTPLPQDFTVSYDVVVPRNFTWGAKGLTFQLANERTPGNPESFVRLKLRPGSGGSDGEATIEAQFPTGYLSGYKYAAATGFSNDKQNNRVTVSVRKTGQTLQVFLDKNRIAEYEKAMPSGQLFNQMSFVILGASDGANDKYYVSNIKIIKEQGAALK